MAITTRFSGHVRRYNGSDIERQDPFSTTTTITEGNAGRRIIAPGSKDISIMPTGLTKATAISLNVDGKLNIELTGESVASLDILPDGIFLLNGSISDVRVWNQNATPSITVGYDISG